MAYLGRSRVLITHGDADGLASAWLVLNTRFPHNTGNSHIIYTGGKSGVDLVTQVSGNIPDGAEVVVADLSSKTNQQGLEDLLNRGCSVEWYDNHEQLPDLEKRGVGGRVDTGLDTSTSTIVYCALGEERSARADLMLENHVAWAVVGAFGDAKDEKAKELAQEHGISDDYLMKLRHIGKLLNYNSFGLVAGPGKVLDDMLAQESPRTFMQTDVFKTIESRYLEDKTALESIKPALELDDVTIYLLPDHSSSRAMLGEFANDLHLADPNKIYLVITPNKISRAYSVSIRTNGKTEASEIAKLFQHGGGRATAAGASFQCTADPVGYVVKKITEAGYAIK